MNKFGFLVLAALVSTGALASQVGARNSAATVAIGSWTVAVVEASTNAGWAFVPVELDTEEVKSAALKNATQHDKQAAIKLAENNIKSSDSLAGVLSGVYQYWYPVK